MASCCGSLAIYYFSPRLYECIMIASGGRENRKIKKSKTSKPSLASVSERQTGEQPESTKHK